MQNKLIAICTIIFSLLFTVESIHAFTLSSANFIIDGANFDNAGGDSASPNYLVVTSTGENVLAQASSGLVFFNPTPTPPPTPTPTSASGSSSTSTSTTTTTAVSATPTPTPTTTVSAPEVSAIPTEAVPSQLFDIRLFLDRQTVPQLKDLVARVVFASFGRMPTPVAMTFTIMDKQRKELVTSVDTTTVETEKVFVKRFGETPLAKGDYVLRLHTRYNTDVEDDFDAPFTLSGVEDVKGWCFLVTWIGIVAFTLIVLLVVKRLRTGRKTL